MISSKWQILIQEQLTDFNWMEFQKQNWKNDEKFIFVFADGMESILTYSEFMTNTHVERVGVKRYLPIGNLK